MTERGAIAPEIVRSNHGGRSIVNLRPELRDRGENLNVPAEQVRLRRECARIGCITENQQLNRRFDRLPERAIRFELGDDVESLPG